MIVDIYLPGDNKFEISGQSPVNTLISVCVDIRDKKYGAKLFPKTVLNSDIYLLADEIELLSKIYKNKWYGFCLIFKIKNSLEVGIILLSDLTSTLEDFNAIKEVLAVQALDRLGYTYTDKYTITRDITYKHAPPMSYRVKYGINVNAFNYGMFQTGMKLKNGKFQLCSRKDCLPILKNFPMMKTVDEFLSKSTADTRVVYGESKLISKYLSDLEGNIYFYLQHVSSDGTITIVIVSYLYLRHFEDGDYDMKKEELDILFKQRYRYYLYESMNAEKSEIFYYSKPISNIAESLKLPSITSFKR
jgi:hypothetical protein